MWPEPALLTRVLVFLFLSPSSLYSTLQLQHTTPFCLVVRCCSDALAGLPRSDDEAARQLLERAVDLARESVAEVARSKHCSGNVYFTVLYARRGTG